MSDRDAEAFVYYEDAARREPAPGAPRRRPDRPLTRHVPVRFPASTIEEVKRLAELDGMTVSAWIRRAVNSALQERTDLPTEPTPLREDVFALLSRLRRDVERLSAALGETNQRVDGRGPNPGSSNPRRRSTRPAIEDALAARRTELAARFQSLDDPFAKMLSTVARDEVAEGMVVLAGALDDEGRARLKREASEAVPRLTGAIEQALADLRTLLSDLHPLATLLRVCFANLFTTRDYFEPTFKGSEAQIELLAGLLLTAGDLNLDAPDPPDPEAVQRVFDALESLDLMMRLLVLASNVGREDERADLRVWSQLRWLSLRGASYVEHATDLARRVLTPLDAEMLRELGFTIDDVIQLAETVNGLVERKANQLLRFAQDEATDFLESVRRGDESHPGVLAVLQSEGPAGVLGRAALARVDYDMTNTLSVSAEEIVEAAPTLRARLEALRVLIGPLGQLPETRYRTAFDLNPLRQSPFVEWQGRIAFPVPGLLMRDYLGVLEPVLLERVPGYGRRRSSAVEEVSLELVADALPGCRTYSNVYYWIETGGRRERVELDGLVLFDRFAVVVEAKSSSLSVQASRGDVERLKRDLQRSIENAGRQAARAVDAILGSASVTFETKSGEPVVSLERSEVERVFAIAPSLHEMGGHAVVPLKLKELGLFTDHDPPWSVFLNDLRVVVDLCRNPAEFLHYMVWRSRLPLGERVIAMDELDVFGAYLLSEGALDRLDDEPDLVVNLASYTTDLDDYYLWRPEFGPRPAKPRKFSVPIVERFIDMQATERPPGWLDSCGAALDLTIENLAAVEARRKRLLERIGPTEVRLEVIGTVALASLGHQVKVSAVLDDLTHKSKGANRLVVLQREDKKSRVVAAQSLR